MEVHDGFIVSIFNYCDQWCATCAFTSRCRLFADVARAEAQCDPQMAAVAHAPPPRQDMPLPPPRWMTEMLDELNDAAGKPLSDEDLRALEPDLPVEHELICSRAMDYAIRTHHWLLGCGARTSDDAGDPVSVIAWFSTLMVSKIRRALIGLAEFDGDRLFPPDHEGSAKVALVGLERSRAAWSRLLAARNVDEMVAQRELEALDWLQAQLEQVIPDAPSFVRPGFDEPGAAAWAAAAR